MEVYSLIFKIGPLISKFVACNFFRLFLHMKSYKNNNYEQALIETFLKFDEILRTEKVNGLLKFYSKSLTKNYEVDMKIALNQFDDNNEMFSDIKNNLSSMTINDQIFTNDKCESKFIVKNFKRKYFSINLIINFF